MEPSSPGNDAGTSPRQPAPRPTDEEKPILEGWLLKKGKSYGTHKTWNDRYFVLRDSTLYYYSHHDGSSSSTSPSEAACKGSYELVGGCEVSDVYMMKDIKEKSKSRRGGSSGGSSKKYKFCIKVTWPGGGDAVGAASASDRTAEAPPPSTPSTSLSPRSRSHHRRTLSSNDLTAVSAESKSPSPTFSRRATLSPSLPRRTSASASSSPLPLLVDPSSSLSLNQSLHRLATSPPGAASALADHHHRRDRKRSQYRKRKRILQGGSIVAATGAVFVTTMLTAGVGLVPGLLVLGVGAAAGGGGAAVGHGYHRRAAARPPPPLVLAADTRREAERWRAALERAAARTDDGATPGGTWAGLFAREGRDARDCLRPTDDGVAAAVAPPPRAPDEPRARWRPLEGGWANALSTGASGLRMFREETEREATLTAPPTRWRTRMLSVKEKLCPPLKAQVILHASPLDAFMCLMSHPRLDHHYHDDVVMPASGQRASFRIVEKFDDHSDVLHLVFRPLYLFPSWTAPRDFCVVRYWRFDDDGTYVVCYDSVVHPACPPTDPYVRGELHGLYTIAPLKRGGTGECLLTHIAQVDPKGWVPTTGAPGRYYSEAFAVSSLLQLSDVRDALDNDRFVTSRRRPAPADEALRKVSAQLEQRRVDDEKRRGRGGRGIANSGSTRTGESRRGDEYDGEHSLVDDRRAHLSAVVDEHDDDEEDDEAKITYDFTYSGGERTSHSALSIVSGDSDSRRRQYPGRQTIATFPEPLPATMWAEPDANSFMVRGKRYKTDKKKYNAGPSVLRLITVDMVRVGSSAHLGGVGSHPKERLQQALARQSERAHDDHDEDDEVDMPPYVVIINIVLPGPPVHHLLMYYAVDDMSSIDGTDGTPFSRLANKFFFGDSDAFRDNTFKLIPQIVEGNFVVRRAVGSTPAIMGTKLKQHYVRDDRFFELVLDVGSSSVAAGVVRLSLGYAKSLVVDMAFLLEGNDETTLPERVMGCCRLKNVDVKKGSRLCEEWEEG